VLLRLSVAKTRREHKTVPFLLLCINRSGYLFKQVMLITIDTFKHF